MEDKLGFIEVIIDTFKKRLWIILLTTIIMTGLSLNKVSKFEESYQSSIRVFIGSSNNLMQIYSPQQISIYGNFVDIFNEIIKVDDILTEPLKEKGIDKTSASIVGGLSFTKSEKIPMFTITYSSGSKKDMEEIVTVVSETLVSKVKELMPETVPTILGSPITRTILPEKTKQVALGFVVGLLAGIGLILLLEFLDDTVKNKDMLERMLPIPVLGDIPPHEKSFIKEETKYVRSK